MPAAPLAAALLGSLETGLANWSDIRHEQPDPSAWGLGPLPDYTALDDMALANAVETLQDAEALLPLTKKGDKPDGRFAKAWTADCAAAANAIADSDRWPAWLESALLQRLPRAVHLLRITKARTRGVNCLLSTAREPRPRRAMGHY